MERVFRISFYPLSKELRNFPYLCPMSDFFTPNLFIDCVLTRFVEMYRDALKRTPISYMTHRHLILFLEEYADCYARNGHANLDELVNEVEQHKQEIGAHLSLILLFFLDVTNFPGFDLTTIRKFENSGLIYFLVTGEDNES